MQERSGEVGKLPPDKLKRLVLDRLASIIDPQVTLGPAIGEDAGIVSLGDLDLIIHSDPITEAEKLLGWLAIIVASNDVAVTGGRPRWASLTLLLPPGISDEAVEEIINDAAAASREVGVDIVSGHTEYTPGLKRPIAVATVIGTACGGCSVPTKNARPGDLVIQVKPAGLEGTAIIASDFADLLKAKGVKWELVDKAVNLIRDVSVVEAALAIAESGLASSMHDPTEGGLIGGLVEISMASRRALRVRHDKIIVSDVTKEITSKLGIDPLKLISSGTLLATIPRENLKEVETVLDDMKLPYSIIGEVLEESGPLVILERGDKVTKFTSVPKDEISRLWELREPGGG